MGRAICLASQTSTLAQYLGWSCCFVEPHQGLMLDFSLAANDFEFGFGFTSSGPLNLVRNFALVGYSGIV